MNFKDNLVLVLGGTGLLGYMLMQRAIIQKLNFIGTKRNKMSFEKSKKKYFLKVNDITNIKLIESIIKKYKPTFIVNCLSLPDRNSNPEKILDLYSIFPKKLAILSHKYNFKIINISSDGIFGGDKNIYTENNIPDPNDIYGKCKFLGEVLDSNVLNIRTSLIGPSLAKNTLFDRVFISNKIKGYKNYIFNGVTNLELSNIIIHIINFKKFHFGTIHVSGEKISKYDLIKKIKKQFNLKLKVEKEISNIPIKRVLKPSKLLKSFNLKINNWDDMILDLKKYNVQK